MMHGREKSGPAVVAVKRANKAARSAAESVEPRAGAEGNASQQNTRRAQNRESVSHALASIRQVKTALPSSTRGGSRMRGARGSWNESASESLVRSKPSRRDGSESCGRRGDAGSEA